MFESFLAVLASTVTNKKVLGAWLVLLTLSVTQIGSAVFVKGESQATATKKDIEHLMLTIDSMNTKLQVIEAKLGEVSGTVLVLRDRSDKAHGKK